MADGERGGMFGIRPSQTVTVNETTETRLTFEKAILLFSVVFIVVWIAYALLNVMFSAQDMFIVVDLLIVPLVAFLYRTLYKFLIKRADNEVVFLFFTFRIDYLLTIFAIGTIVYAIDNVAGFVVWMLVWPYGAPVAEFGLRLFAFLVLNIFISTIASVVPFIYRLFVEVKDQYHSPLEVAKIKAQWRYYEKPKLELQRQWAVEDAESEEDDEELPLSVSPVKNLLIAENKNRLVASEAQRATLASVEFLRGIEAGLWSTDEKSWKDKRLVQSGYDVVAVGDSIRDHLIAAHYASWRNPDVKRKGWRLDYSPEHIIKNGLGFTDFPDVVEPTPDGRLG